MKSNTNWGAWLQEFQGDQPYLIAGPCSAETEEQVMATAKGVHAAHASIFRAGIWKPRTRPGGFEGVGSVALPWLQKVKAETGMLIAVEVANAAQVKAALAHDVDVLWIGARTTVNPFAVQEIADVLQNTDKIVLVKNPVNPDLALWIGAMWLETFSATTSLIMKTWRREMMRRSLRCTQSAPFQSMGGTSY